jgi:predicted Zn-dependent peptidase
MTDTILHTCERLEERYYDIRHLSGLRILVAPKELSACYATVGVRYGSRDRLSPCTVPMGTAHFLEHKMFEREDGSSWEDVFAALGAEVNAYTSDDCTAYMFSATERIPEAVTALLRMVSELTVTRASVRRERSIIAEEIRMNADDPWEVCYARMLRGMYAPVREGGNPVREEICGTEASIRRITPALLKKTHGSFYRPDNMVLAVAGRVTLEEIVAAVDAAGLAALPSTPAVSTRRVKESDGVYRGEDTVIMDTAKPLFSIGVKIPHIPAEPEALICRERQTSVLSEMLLSRSGDFYNRLFESGTVSPGMSYGSSLGRPALGEAEGYGYFYLSGECDDPEAVYKAFLDYVEEIREKGLDPDALTRARRTLYADYIYGFDSTEGIASALLGSAMDGVELFDLPEIDGSLTVEELWSLFERVFRPSQYTLSSVLPTEKNS